jgi:hypothetical protein
VGSLPILSFRQLVEPIDGEQFGKACTPDLSFGQACKPDLSGDLMASETYTEPVAQPRRSPTDRSGAPVTLRPGLRPRQRTAPEAEAGGHESASNEPRLRQLMGVCGWAAVLGGVGLVIGIRDLIAVVTQSSPGWFEPVMSAIGLVGIALTVGGFLTVHRQRAPWIFLGGGSVMLIAGMIVTSTAL